VEGFDFRLKTKPEDFERGRERLKDAVASAFGVTLRAEPRETDVLLLEPLPGATAPAAAAPGGKRGLMGYGSGRLLGTATAAEFARALYSASDLPVLDATGRKDAFALDLEWKRGDAAARDQALATAGLRLSRAPPRLDIYVAAPAPPREEDSASARTGTRPAHGITILKDSRAVGRRPARTPSPLPTGCACGRAAADSRHHRTHLPARRVGHDRAPDAGSLDSGRRRSR
jgi:hypothetical protein